MKIFLILLSFILTNCSFSTVEESSIQNSDSSTSVLLKNETRIPIDSSWDQYTNTYIGFTMRVPASAKINSGSGYAEILRQDYMLGWRVQSSPATREELPELVKKLFGKDCIILKTAPWHDDTEQIIGTLPDSFAFGTGDCKPRGSAWAIIFREKVQKLIYWELGQEDRFSGSGDIMSHSFHFFP